MDNVDFQSQTTSEEDIVEGGIAEVAPDLYEIHLLSIAWPYQGIVAQHRRGPATQRGLSGPSAHHTGPQDDATAR